MVSSFSTERNDTLACLAMLATGACDADAFDDGTVAADAEVEEKTERRCSDEIRIHAKTYKLSVFADIRPE